MEKPLRRRSISIRRLVGFAVGDFSNHRDAGPLIPLTVLIEMSSRSSDASLSTSDHANSINKFWTFFLKPKRLQIASQKVVKRQIL